MRHLDLRFLLPVLLTPALFALLLLAGQTSAAPGDTVADRVFGQGGSFASGTCNPGMIVSASTMCHPFGVVVDAGGNFYVADSGNQRVVEYNTPLTIDAVPAGVFGQGGSFTIGTCNPPMGIPSANSLCGPEDVAVDAAGNLYVADNNNNRVLEYNTPLTMTATPGSGDTVADR